MVCLFSPSFRDILAHALQLIHTVAAAAEFGRTRKEISMHKFANS
jgi:hypothetical protein